MQTPKPPEQLVQDLARRRAVLFLGAGVSRGCKGDHGKKPPLWEGFLRACAGKLTGTKKHVNTLIKSGEFLTAAEILKHELNDQWAVAITEEFVTPGFKHAKIHETIFKLDSRFVLTQNVDKIYDTYAQSESKNTIVIKSYSDNDVAAVLRGEKRCVIKAHGTVDAISKMVFTRGEYATARHQYSSFYSLMDALALTHTFLFIGCGTSDPDVQLMLERIAQLHPFGRPHFMLMRKGAIPRQMIDSLNRTMNIRILEYKNTKDHRHLLTYLEALCARVDEFRETLSENRDW